MNQCLFLKWEGKGIKKKFKKKFGREGREPSGVLPVIRGTDGQDLGA